VILEFPTVEVPVNLGIVFTVPLPESTPAIVPLISTLRRKASHLCAVSPNGPPVIDGATSPLAVMVVAVTPCKDEAPPTLKVVPTAKAFVIFPAAEVKPGDPPMTTRSLESLASPVMSALLAWFLKERQVSEAAHASTRTISRVREKLYALDAAKDAGI
jgi:hypothetical protein